MPTDVMHLCYKAVSRSNCKYCITLVTLNFIELHYVAIGEKIKRRNMSCDYHHNRRIIKAARKKTSKSGAKNFISMAKKKSRNFNCLKQNLFFIVYFGFILIQFAGEHPDMILFVQKLIFSF